MKYSVAFSLQQLTTGGQCLLVPGAPTWVAIPSIWKGFSYPQGAFLCPLKGLMSLVPLILGLLRIGRWVHYSLTSNTCNRWAIVWRKWQCLPPSISWILIMLWKSIDADQSFYIFGSPPNDVETWHKLPTSEEWSISFPLSAYGLQVLDDSIAERGSGGEVIRAV